MTELCNSGNCLNLATHRVFWLGRPPRLLCALCAAAAAIIGEAVGSYVHAKPMEATPPGPRSMLALGDTIMGK